MVLRSVMAGAHLGILHGGELDQRINGARPLKAPDSCELGVQSRLFSPLANRGSRVQRGKAFLPVRIASV